jgi:glycosyltransferase involved in cell wall biosynthesis
VVHIANFADEPPVTAVARAELDTPPAVPLLLAAGRLHTNKGFDVLLRALQQLPQAWLWLAGSGPEAQALQRLARELGVAARVRWLGWRGDVTALMRSADVFVCPSRHEGLGSIVLESWAHDCPLVATRSQGPAELIRHEHDGLLADIDDSAGLARAIATLLDSAGLRQQLAQAGRQRYQREFSRARISADYREFFSAVRPCR